MSEPRSVEPHPVYPGGPLCNPECPGPWSQYHDGYADGYEAAAQASAAPDEIVLLRKLAEVVVSIYGEGEEANGYAVELARRALAANSVNSEDVA